MDQGNNRSTRFRKEICIHLGVRHMIKVALPIDGAGKVRNSFGKNYLRNRNEKTRVVNK